MRFIDGLMLGAAAMFFIFVVLIATGHLDGWIERWRKAGRDEEG